MARAHDGDDQSITVRRDRAALDICSHSIAMKLWARAFGCAQVCNIEMMNNEADPRGVGASWLRTGDTSSADQTCREVSRPPMRVCCVLAVGAFAA